MIGRRILYILALVFFLLPLTGCIYSREISHTRRDIERHYPKAAFDKEVVLNFGPASMRVIRWTAGLVRDEDVQMARNYLREIRRVKVGVYRTEYLPPLGEMKLPALRRFEANEWETAVHVREDNESTWLLYKAHGDEVRDVFVISLSGEELVLIRVRGHLNRLVARIMEDHAVLEEFTGLDF